MKVTFSNHCLTSVFFFFKIISNHLYNYIVVAHRKKGRHSHFSRTQPPQQPQILSSPAREGLTYAEAQKFVEFELNGKVKRISIHQIIPVLSRNKEEIEVAKHLPVCYLFVILFYN